MNREKEEILRLREELRQLNDFKSSVSEIFSMMNVPVWGHSPSSDNVEQYITQLHGVVRRVQPLREQDYQDIQACAKTVIKNKGTSNGSSRNSGINNYNGSRSNNNGSSNSSSGSSRNNNVGSSGSSGSSRNKY